MYGRRGNLEKAIEMFNTAKSLGLSIDEKTYTNMISYYGKSGRIFPFYHHTFYMHFKTSWVLVEASRVRNIGK